MSERTERTTPTTDHKPGNAPAADKSRQLGEDALDDVAGGLNPQPLPPGHVMPET